MFFCPKSFGRFKNELHCDTFYACFFNQPYLIYCPPPLLFSSKTNNCEWPEDSDSDCSPPKPSIAKPQQPNTTTPKTIAPTTEKPFVYDCPEADGFFPDPNNCTAYYFCEDNVGSKMYCAIGKGFNSKYLSCNEPNDSDCAKERK